MTYRCLVWCGMIVAADVGRYAGYTVSVSDTA